MKLREFKFLLSKNPNARVGFTLPDGEQIEPSFHVTEVGHVVKNFVDCGGTTRRAEACVLQTWVGPDQDHRLTAQKLAQIVELGGAVVPGDELDVEGEYDCCVISQYGIRTFRTIDEGLSFQLATKHTDCLAKERCGINEEACCSDAAQASCC